jgi:hypothetical protein
MLVSGLGLVLQIQTSTGIRNTRCYSGAASRQLPNQMFFMVAPVSKSYSSGMCLRESVAVLTPGRCSP